MHPLDMHGWMYLIFSLSFKETQSKYATKFAWLADLTEGIHTLSY